MASYQATYFIIIVQGDSVDKQEINFLIAHDMYVLVLPRQSQWAVEREKGRGYSLGAEFRLCLKKIPSADPEIPA